MQYAVIVIGAGIGGLTTAALLAARGVNVCLLERQSQVGGCAANVEHLGYTFEPTFGMYSGWEDGGAWHRIFAELPVSLPQVTKLSPNYVVHLPDGRNVEVSADSGSLEAAIRSAFPECADAAIGFISRVTRAANGASLTDLLEGTSQEFRWFIDAQLQTFAQRTSTQCSLTQATAAFQFATGAVWSIEGGAQALADRLADSIKGSGASLRLNSPVLRLAYGNDGTPIGVDLLNGERVIARRAIVSNLTIWDTYGKLIGPGRTPREVATQLKKLTAWGAYQMFLGIDEAAIDALPGPRAILTFEPDRGAYDPERDSLALNLITTVGKAPAGKRALTTIAFTHAEDWFGFHEDHSWHEERDQGMLETWWARLHRALPQLGDSLEVIETGTPQTVYETTRRKFGMVGAPLGIENLTPLERPFPNLFIIGDTVSEGLGMEGVAHSALKVADQITHRAH